MGEMVRIECEGCGIVEEAAIGLGMLGVGHALVACPTCRAFEEIPLDRFERAAGALVCPDCSGPAVEVTSFGRAPCPACGGALRVDLVGMWD